jgi:hypothetical protein
MTGVTKVKYWRETIEKANQQYKQQHFKQAEKLYLQAADQAKLLASHWIEPETAVSALVISYQNLADLYMKTRQPFRAMSILEEVHNTLQNLSVQSEQHAQSIDGITTSNACLAGARKVYLMLLSLLNELKVPSGPMPISLSPSTH